MKKVYLDPGHGGTDSGAVGNGIKEKDITLKIGLKTRNILLNRYQGVEIKMSRTTDVYPELSERTTEANSWGADVFVSIHINAGGDANGFETYRYESLLELTRLQTLVHNNIYNRMSDYADWILDRGKKRADFHVLRESNMPAVLTENLFITHPASANLLKTDAFLEKVAEGHAVGIAQSLRLLRKDDMSLFTKDHADTLDMLRDAFKSENQDTPQEDIGFLREKILEIHASAQKLDNILVGVNEVTVNLESLVRDMWRTDGLVDNPYMDPTNPYYNPQATNKAWKPHKAIEHLLRQVLIVKKELENLRT